MKLGNVTHNALKAFLCLVCAMALALFPPSAVHATSGTHGAHHAPVQMAADHNHAHGDISVHFDASGKIVAASDFSGDEDVSEPCCNGICMSFVLVEEQSLAFEQRERDSYLALYGQSNSTETAGFLRPPKHLI